MVTWNIKHMDGYVQQQVEIIKKRLKQNWDCVGVVDGVEGCQPKGNRVLMADGTWKDIANVIEGDLVISPQVNGTNIFAKVVKTISYEDRRIYSVSELNRNKKELYTCSGEHKIPIYQKVGKKRIWGTDKRTFGYWKLFNKPAEYCCCFSKGMQKNTTTMLSPPIEKYYGRTNCLVEPYTLGIWLGDGHWGSNVGITSNDPKVIAEVEKTYKSNANYGKVGTTCRSYRFLKSTGLKDQLAHYGLANTKSGTKFIPQQAMLSDLFYRRKLLAGLIDSDGYYRHGGYSITSKSKRLSNDIANLVRSVGGLCNGVRQVEKGIKKLNFKGTYYMVTFKCPDLPLIINYKKRVEKRFYLSTNRCAIQVKQTEKYGRVYGIQVESPTQLYITNDYVVTHNSGKTTFAFQLCKAIDPTFNIDRVCFNVTQWNEQVIKCKPGQAVCLDEAMVVFFKRATMSQTNILMVRVLAECRKKNLLLIFNIPSFFEMDRYPALHRASFLVHVYTMPTPKGDAQRGYFRWYDKKAKKKLYLEGRKAMIYQVAKPSFYGKFSKAFVVSKKDYEAKKDKALMEKSVKSEGKVEKIWKDKCSAIVEHTRSLMGWSQKETIAKLKAAHIKWRFPYERDYARERRND